MVQKINEIVSEIDDQVCMKLLFQSSAWKLLKKYTFANLIGGN